MPYRQWSQDKRAWFWVAITFIISTVALAVSLGIITSRRSTQQRNVVRLPDRVLVNGALVSRRTSSRVAVILKGRAAACWCQGRHPPPGARTSGSVVPQGSPKRDTEASVSAAQFRTVCGLADVNRCVRVDASNHIAGIIANVITPLQTDGYSVDVYLHLPGDTPDDTAIAMVNGLNPVWAQCRDVDPPPGVGQQWFRTAEAIAEVQSHGPCEFIVIARPDLEWLRPIQCPDATTHPYMLHKERGGACDVVITIPGTVLSKMRDFFAHVPMHAQSALSRQLAWVTGRSVRMLCPAAGGLPCGSWSGVGQANQCVVIDGGQLVWSKGDHN